MGGALKSITKPFESAFEWAGDMVAPEIDTGNQAAAIREQARQQARQAAESARQAANTQATQSQREQLLRQRDEDSDVDTEDADVRVGDDGEFDTARKRRQQFTGSSNSSGASIRI